MYLAAREEPGVTSRLRKFGSTRDFWDLPCGGRLPFPMVLDVQKIDPAARTLKWRIEALVGLVDNVPKINGVCVTSVGPAGSLASTCCQSDTNLLISDES